MFAVISDIHANFDALKEVLNYLDSINIDRIYCLGDVVGYGPEPEIVIQAIKRKGINSCLGNHDNVLVNPDKEHKLNIFAQDALKKTQNDISQDSLKYLLGMELKLYKQNCQFVHSSPCSTGNWNYIYTGEQAKEVFNSFEEHICLIGHTHCPKLFYKSGQAVYKEEVQLKHNKKYLVNVGSVGQPRDGNPKACFVIYNEEIDKIIFKRIEYEIQNTYNKIMKKNLPVFLAERLLTGI